MKKIYIFALFLVCFEASAQVPFYGGLMLKSGSQINYGTDVFFNTLEVNVDEKKSVALDEYDMACAVDDNCSFSFSLAWQFLSGLAGPSTSGSIELATGDVLAFRINLPESVLSNYEHVKADIVINYDLDFYSPENYRCQQINPTLFETTGYLTEENMIGDGGEWVSFEGGSGLRRSVPIPLPEEPPVDGVLVYFLHVCCDNFQSNYMLINSAKIVYHDNSSSYVDGSFYANRIRYNSGNIDGKHYSLDGPLGSGIEHRLVCVDYVDLVRPTGVAFTDVTCSGTDYGSGDWTYGNRENFYPMLIGNSNPIFFQVVVPDEVFADLDRHVAKLVLNYDIDGDGWNAKCRQVSDELYGATGTIDMGSMYIGTWESTFAFSSGYGNEVEVPLDLSNVTSENRTITYMVHKFCNDATTGQITYNYGKVLFYDTRTGHSTKVFSDSIYSSTSGVISASDIAFGSVIVDNDGLESDSIEFNGGANIPDVSVEANLSFVCEEINSVSEVVTDVFFVRGQILSGSNPPTWTCSSEGLITNPIAFNRFDAVSSASVETNGVMVPYSVNLVGCKISVPNIPFSDLSISLTLSYRDISVPDERPIKITGIKEEAWSSDTEGFLIDEMSDYILPSVGCTFYRTSFFWNGTTMVYLDGVVTVDLPIPEHVVPGQYLYYIIQQDCSVYKFATGSILSNSSYYEIEAPLEKTSISYSGSDNTLKFLMGDADPVEVFVYDFDSTSTSGIGYGFRGPYDSSGMTNLNGLTTGPDASLWNLKEMALIKMNGQDKWMPLYEYIGD